jgi:tricorn protease
LSKSVTVLVSVFFLIFALSAIGESAPLNLRHPAPSPDGSKICFSHIGDLWIVSSQGGKAERLTVHVGYDAYPRWSPDGNYIAFSSQRHGNFDVYVIPAAGGTETRLTYHSADDITSGWTPDSKRVLFTSKREQAFETVWEVSAVGGRARPLVMVQAADGRKCADNNKLLFTHGAVPWWRKDYHGSAACDLYAKDLGSGNIERITTYSGNDLDGSWLPGGSRVIYLSDSTGTYNAFTRDLNSGAVSQLTNHRLNASHLSLSQDGSLAAYELGGEIFLYDLRTSQGRRLEVELVSGAKTNLIERVVLDSGATEFAISPDGKMVAYVAHGNVFCGNLGDWRQRQLTDSPANDCDIKWSSDSKELTFISNRDGRNDIYLLRSSDPGQPSLALSNEREAVALIGSDALKRSPAISPDKGKIAFVRGETQLVAADMKRFTERTLGEKSQIGSFDWSPDGRYLVFTQFNANWQNELYLGDSESGAIYKISEAPGSYQEPHFSADGALIYYINNNDISYLFLEQRLSEMAAAGNIKQGQREVKRNALGLPMVMIDFDNITSRHARLTHSGDVTALAMLPNSQALLFATAENQLERVNLDGSDQRNLAEIPSGLLQLQFGASSTIAYFSDRGGRLYSIDLDSGSVETVPLRAEMIVDSRREYLQVFNETWQMLRERFYDQTMHGVDWNKIRESYFARAEVATELNDLHDIIREMVGELNASHLNIWPRQLQGDETGYLGVIPDYEDNSAGLKVKAVIPHSPAAAVAAMLKIDEKIMAVDGRKIITNQDYYIPFEGTAGREVTLSLINREGISRSVNVTPVSAEDYRELESADRTTRMRELVDKLSTNKVAYLRLSQIDRDGAEQFERDFSVYASDKQAMIIDLRDNVGGSEHDRLLQLLTRRKYITHQPRYGLNGTDSPVAFAGPILLLINETTSSDAEILAQGFRELVLGTIAGVTTYGAVIGTEHRSLLDGSTFTVPSVGWFTLKGDKLENRGVAPDTEIPSDLTRFDRGEDNQIEQSVQILLLKIQ